MSILQRIKQYIRQLLIRYGILKNRRVQVPLSYAELEKQLYAQIYARPKVSPNRKRRRAKISETKRKHRQKLTAAKQRRLTRGK
jgi:competence transcription factor ComK